MRGDGHIQFMAEGLSRFRVLEWNALQAPFVASVDYPEPPLENPQEVRAYALAIIAKIKELLPHNPFYKENLKAYLERFSPDEPSPLADFAAALTTGGADELQDILETVPLLRRMEKVMLLLQREVEVAGLQSEIRQKVEERVQERQREFFLREQMRAIQRELGEGERVAAHACAEVSDMRVMLSVSRTWYASRRYGMCSGEAVER